MDEFLISQVEFTVANDRVNPDFSLWTSLLGLWIEREAAQLLESIRRGFDQDDLPIVFL